MGAVFVQATLIGWQPILFDAMDATSDGNSPKIYNTPEAFIYFLIGTFVFGILAVNLLMGAIFDSFIQIKDKVSGKDFGLDVEQKKLRSHEEHLMALRPIISDVQAKSQFRRRVQAMVNSNRFKYKWIILVLLIQTLVLCATHVGQSDQFTLFQVIVSHCVAVLFLVETVLKLYGHGVKPYFCRKSNIFDFVISLIGLLDLILFPNGCGADINLLTRLRALRIFRLFPLLSHSKRLHFLTTIMEPLPAMLSVLLLMSYVAFFYANLGVQLYSGVKLQADRSTTYIFTDFRNLRHGFEMMTILATGDSWTDFLIEFIDQSQDVNFNITYIFFGSYFVIQVWILVNIFVLFIVENFELMNSEDIQRREIIIKGFKMAWAKYDPEGTGRIRRGDLPALLVDVPAPLGVARDDHYLTLAQTVDRIECQPCFFKDDAHMEIQDWLGFNDVLVSMCAIAFHPLKIVANDIPDIQLLFQKSIAEQIIRTFLKKIAAKHNAQKNSNGVLHKQAPNKKSLKQERQSDQTRETESLSTTSSFNK
uniref:Ion transport domain-containing protein n=2 Tax=Heterosigma akashiwo TaxID=2829 RepID=A0A7S3XP61_HETAK